MLIALSAQSLVVLVTAAVIGGWKGWLAAQAALFGGAVALTNTGLLVLRWWRGLTKYHCDGPRHLQSFRRSGQERFFVVVVMLAVGLFGMHLLPGPTLTGFIAGQFAWVLAMAFVNAD